MSRPSYVIKGYVGAAATMINSWLLLPIKIIDLNPNPSSDDQLLGNISTGLSAISFSALFVYYYDKYYKEYIESKSVFVKWLIFGLVVLHVVAIGICFYLLLKDNKADDKAKKIFSRIALPFFSTTMGVLHVVFLIATGCKEVTAAKVLNSINGLLSLTTFLPLDEILKKKQEVYVAIHSVRALLQAAEAGTLFYEIISHPDEEGDQSEQPELVPAT